MEHITTGKERRKGFCHNYKFFGFLSEVSTIWAPQEFNVAPPPPPPPPAKSHVSRTGLELWILLPGFPKC